MCQNVILNVNYVKKPSVKKLNSRTMRLDEKEVDMRELRVSEVTFKVIKLLKKTFDESSDDFGNSSHMTSKSTLLI